MATVILWRGGNGNDPIDPSGINNTIGFFGAVFGQSVRVGEFQDSTFVTDSDGAVNSGEIDNNNKFVTSSTVKIGASSAEAISGIDVIESTLRIQFNNTTPVQLQNTSFRAFDRVNINNPQSGVIVQAFEASNIISGHIVPASGGDINTQGDNTWTQISGATALPLITQSGISVDHYHYIGLSASPTQIGQKKDLGFYYETEFL